MLEHIALKNFKALQSAEIDLGMITALIGANGTGKSSIIQALTVLKQSVGAEELKLDGPHISLGEYRDIVRNNKEREEVCISIRKFISKPVEPIFKGNARFSYEAVFNKQGLRTHRCGIESGGKVEFEAEFVRQPATYMNVRPEKFEFNQVSFNIRSQPAIAVPLRIKSGGYPSESDEARMQYTIAGEALNKLFSSVQDTLQNTYYVPALRGFVEPSYTLVGQVQPDLSTGAGADLQARNVASTLVYRRDLESKVSDWTKRITGTSIEAVVAPGPKVIVEAVVGSRRTNIINEGFGTNQLVQTMLQLAISPSGSIISIEEPEIHIHPEAQSRLCKILVEVAKEEGKQIILTTHSDHILTNLLNSVANKKLKAKDLAVYYFEKDRDRIRISLLAIDNRGQIKGGLKGFFEASMVELEEYMKAISQEKTK